MAGIHDFPRGLDNVWVYLRKSREDSEAEERARREGRHDIETLARHRNKLLQLARDNHWTVTQIFEEVVSGEYISQRPAMLRLLEGVEQGEPDAVLAMDIDRLGRGDMEDQGRILRIFRETGTLILTPDKVYDLTDEMDEEWTEFKAFFARRELKMITKRMQRGRQASVQEGKYLGTRPPFGYDIDENLILVPNQDADTVRLIFDLHVHQRMGGGHIANYLNAIGLRSPSGKRWRAPSVIAILRNEHYAGYIVWKKIKVDKRKGTRRKRPDSEIIRVKGRHEALISEDIFEQSAAIRASRSNHPAGLRKGIVNPLAGLVECAFCGEKLVRRPQRNQPAHLMCKNPECKQRSTRLDIVEDRVLKALRDWFADYHVSAEEVITASATSEYTTHDKTVSARLDADIARVQTQLASLYDFLEQGIYDTNTFLQRQEKLTAELALLEERRKTIGMHIARAQESTQEPFQAALHIDNIVDWYHTAPHAKAQNQLLHALVQKIIYKKESWQRGDQFSLFVFPKL